MSTATTAVFLTLGMDNERRSKKGPWPTNKASEESGFIGLVEYIAEMAKVLENEWDRNYSTLDCPGVWDYEVTEEMGAWLYRNPDATANEFSAELHRFVAEWIKR